MSNIHTDKAHEMCDQTKPEKNMDRILVKEIRLEQNSTKRDDFIGLIEAARRIHKQISNGIEPNPVETTEQLLLSCKRANILEDLVNIEYFFQQLSELHLPKNTPQIYFTQQYIEFAYDFGAKCSKDLSLLENFRNIFVDQRITNDTTFIESCFRLVFYLNMPVSVNFYFISCYTGFEKRAFFGIRYIQYIKKRLIEMYIVEAFNRYEVSKPNHKLHTANLDRLCSVLATKINALNGCVYKNILRTSEIKRFIFIYLYMKLNESKFVAMDEYNDAVLFYTLLLHHIKQTIKNKNKNTNKMHTIKMLLMVELKWELNDRHNKHINDTKVYEDFLFEYQNTVAGVNKVKYAFYKPKYNLKMSGVLCQVYKTETGTIYTRKKENVKTEKDAGRVGISPFSGKISKIDENNTNITAKKKLEFE
ncbi:hypothetical protein ECANGB1_1964 [Enterospora canceri]|uniref:Uncharacterized protein n=1 Tax=Enterospora canceri TaxID=1081671 RepID=A0A1Y1S5A7_9MICR|nr:hypothetical protein ECANGB1_1964 [Enterospora canceri]